MRRSFFRRQFEVGQFGHALDIFYGYFGGHALLFSIRSLRNGPFERVRSKGSKIKYSVDRFGENCRSGLYQGNRVCALYGRGRYPSRREAVRIAQGETLGMRASSVPSPRRGGTNPARALDLYSCVIHCFSPR